MSTNVPRSKVDNIDGSFLKSMLNKSELSKNSVKLKKAEKEIDTLCSTIKEIRLLLEDEVSRHMDDLVKIAKKKYFSSKTTLSCKESKYCIFIPNPKQLNLPLLHSKLTEIALNVSDKKGYLLTEDAMIEDWEDVFKYPKVRESPKFSLFCCLLLINKDYKKAGVINLSYIPDEEKEGHFTKDYIDYIRYYIRIPSSNDEAITHKPLIIIID